MTHKSIFISMTSFLVALGFSVSAFAADRPTHPDDLYYLPRTCQIVKNEIRQKTVARNKSKKALKKLNKVVQKKVIPAAQVLCNKDRKPYVPKYCSMAMLNLYNHMKVKQDFKKNITVLDLQIRLLHEEILRINCKSNGKTVP